MVDLLGFAEGIQQGLGRCSSGTDLGIVVALIGDHSLDMQEHGVDLQLGYQVVEGDDGGLYDD